MKTGPLYCRMGKCRRPIMAMTGYQEVCKLMTHIRRVHRIGLTMDQALALRVRFENGEDVPEGQV